MIRVVYGDLARLCRAQGAQLIILILGSGETPYERQAIQAIPGALVVDAEASLQKASSYDPSTYDKMFGHWSGSPPRIFDRHPNAQANEMIARTLLSAMRRSVK